MTNDTTSRGIGDVCLRRRNETDAQFAKREFNYYMWQVGRCYMLQSIRRNEQYYAAAIFYQCEAARWYDRAMVCRARYDKTLAELIPGTAVRWDEIFAIRKPRYSITWDEINAMIPPLFDMDQREYRIEPKAPRVVMRPTSDQQLLADGFYCNPGDIVVVPIAKDAVVFDGRWDEIFTIRKPRPSHYQTPAQKFDNPRDVPMTLTDQMRDLIDGIGKRKR